MRPAIAAIFFVLISGWVHGQIAITDSVRTHSTLTNTVATLTGKSELHITGTGNPIAGSIIHLDSHESWLWFTNIRPATVNANLLGQIRVSGANAVHGGNVRVVQYGMGTVVTPFTNAEQPLETFTDPGFLGGSRRYNLYTYYDTAAKLGTMHENISSFKLKRGFMASFGTRADGTGASKVYIAQDHDVNIGVMPGNLDNAIRFVRVFPWRWVSKKGSCDVSADAVDAAWYYNWNNNQESTLNWEYVPIRQQRWWPNYPTNKNNVTHLLGFNEPDNPIEDSYQTLSNGSRDAALAAWPELLATGLRVGSPACTDAGKWWLYDFMDKANAAGRRVDYIALHFYRCGQSTAQLQAWLQEVWDRYQKPIWLTEFNNGANWTNCGDPTPEQNAAVISSWIDMLDNTPWIERYAVFSDVEWQRNLTWNASWDAGSGLTPAGIVYRDNRSPIGYVQEIYPLAVRRGIVHLPMNGHTRDVSGHDHTGVSYGVPEFIAGPNGQALDFNGSNRHVKLPPGIVNSASFTFAAWVRWDGGSANQRIFDFGNSTDQFLFLSPSTGGQMRFGLRNNNGTTNSIAAAPLPTGSWQHVAVTMQGSAAKIYLNGNLHAQGNVSGPTLSGTSNNLIGRSQWSTDPLFDGALDEVFIIDSALDETKIAELMAGVSSPFSVHWTGDVDGQWSTNNAGNTNWAVDSAGTSDSGQSPGAFTEVNFSSGTANTTLGEDTAIDSMVVTTPDPVIIGGAHALGIGPKGIYVGNDAGPVTINTSGGVNLQAEQTWVNNSNNALTADSVLNGSGKLTVSGAGRVALGGVNTWTGDLSIIGGGSVAVSSVTDALGTAGQVGMGGGGFPGALVYTGTGETSGRVLTFQGGFGSPGIIIDHSGSGLLKLTSNFSSVAQVSKTLTLQGSTTGEGEISGVISNSGSTTSLVKLGTGKWTLSGANTFTGTSSLQEGVIVAAHNAAFGTGTIDLRGAAIHSSDASLRTIANPVSLSADTTFGGPGDLRFTGAVAGGTLAKTFRVENPRTEFTGVISGSGARTKTGPGSLVLAAANTYTGPTTVSEGTLVVNGSTAAASTITVQNGATLTGTGKVNGTVNFNNGSRLGWSLAANETESGKLTTGPVIVAAGAVVDLIFNTSGSTVDFTDNFWTQIRTWPILTSGGTTGNFSLGSVSTDSLGNSIGPYGDFHLQQTSTGVVLFFAPEGLEPPPPPTGFASVATHGSVKLSWNESEGSAAYLILRSLDPGGPYEIIANVVSSTSYEDLSALDGITYYYAISASNPNGISDPSEELQATPHPPSIIAKADNAANLETATSWTGNILPTALDTALWHGLAGSNSVMLESDVAWHRIQLGTTGGPVGIGGSGTLALGTGGIDLASASADLAIASHLRLTPGRQIWNVPTGRSLHLLTGTFTRNTGTSLNIEGAGTVSAAMNGLANDASANGGIIGAWASTGTGVSTRFATISGGNITPLTGSTTTWGGTINSTTANYEIAANGTSTYGASERVAHTIRYSGGSGTVISLGNNSSAGLTTNGIINAGTGSITFQHGPGALAASGLRPGSTNELVLNAANAGIVINSRIHNNGANPAALTITGTAGVTMNAAHTYTGGTTVASGTVTLAGGNLGPGNLHIVQGAAINLIANQTLSQTVTGRGNLSNNGGTATLSGDFSGFAGTYTHNSTTTSSAANSTTALSRRAAYHIASTQGSSQGLITNVPSGNNTFELGALSGVTNSLLRNGASVTGNTTLRVGYLNTDTTFAGIIGGGGGTLSLTKVGQGTLTLSGNCTYTGATRIESGTLMVHGALHPNSVIRVRNGGRLGGTGTANGPVTVETDGILAPGNGQSGTLTLGGAITFEDNAILATTIGSEASRIAMSSEPTLNGTTRLRVVPAAGFTTGTYPLITGAGEITASGFIIDEAPEGYIYLLAASGGTLSLTVATPPIAPAGFTATGGNTAVALQWTASPGASHYTVKRGSPGGNDHETIATVFGPAFNDSTTSPGDIHSYIVTAWNAAGESEPSPAAIAGLTTHIKVWRYIHFGTTDDSGNAADSEDPDNDGINNLLEYALGTDPNSSNAADSPQLTEPSDRLTLTFTRNAHALDVVTSVWVTDDINSGNWQEIARGTGGALFSSVIDGVSSGAIVSETGTGAIHTVVVADAIEKSTPSHPRRFMRVTVSK